MEKNIILFMKFGKKKNLKKLLEGEAHMKNLQYYVDLENATGNDSMGDKTEASLILNSVDFKINHKGTGKEIFIGSGGITLHSPEDKKKPVFCVFALEEQHLKVVNQNDRQVFLSLNLSEKMRAEFKNNFGEHVIILNAKKFKEKLIKEAQRDGLNVFCDKVKYSNYAINESSRLESISSCSNNTFFWKNLKYEIQNEFRFVINNLEVEQFHNQNIGDIKEIAFLTETENLFNDFFEFVVNK